MEAYFARSIGIFDYLLKPVAWLIASSFLAPWICNPNFLMKNILQFLQIIESIGGYTRLDLSYNVSVLSQFWNAPCQLHWQAAICVIRYLVSTNDHDLLFRGDIELIGYSDADWAKMQTQDGLHLATTFCLTQVWFLGNPRNKIQFLLHL